jgi:N-acetylneuraminic acid mutarotase
MKKAAHLLWGVFHLPLIVVLCMIPFALGQRVTIVRTASPITALTPTPTPCASVRTWTEQAPYPIVVSGHAVASVGGSVYGFGGIVNNVAIANAYKYTPATNNWSAIAPLPAARYWFTAVSDGTYIYLLGGLNENGLPRAFLWRYDPVSNIYDTSLSPPTIATYFHGSAYLNGKIYRIGGRGMGTDFHVEVYDIATNSWSMAANFPYADAYLMAAALDGYIYAGGGFGTGCYRYNPVTDTWTPIASLAVTRSVAASDAFNGRWVLAGGDVVFVPSTSVIAWDPTTNTWNDLPNMLQPRDLLAGATAGQSFYAVAGNAGVGIPTNDNQQYTETPCGTPSPTATSTPIETPTPRFAPTPRVRPTPPPRP